LSNVRVTYSGLIAFVVGIASTITGFVFTIIVTRRLSPEDLGLWTLIGSLVSYVVIVEPIISYWTSRQIARGEKVGKTAVLTSGAFSAAATIAYFVIAVYITYALKTNAISIFLASALVPLTFLGNTLTGISLSHKPHAVSYGMIVFEIAKLPLGFGFVFIGQMGLFGAILATIFASLAKVIILLVMAHQELYDKINLQTIRYWLKLFWIPLYASFTGLIFSLDVLVYSLLTNSLIGLAYWGVTNTISNIVIHSGQMSQALYPKLLAQGRKEFAEENLKRLMYFAIPILALSIVLAKPALFILNPKYAQGFYIVYFLSIRSIINILTNVFYNVLAAYETVDLEKQASFKQYVKSKLFVIPTLSYVMNGSYVILLAVFLIMVKGTTMSEVNMVIVWSIILLVTSIPFMIYGLAIVKRQYKITFPIRIVLKYAGATLVSSMAIYFVSSSVLSYTMTVYEFVPRVILSAGIGAGVYLGITYAIDKSTRELLGSIAKELKIK
jgi:O-antigen/teichoic acid export membrane protein